jgi:hypothetical protein
MLDQAMREFLSGTQKPHLRTYAREMLRERLALLPPPTRIEDQFLRIDLAYSTPLPHLGMYRVLARAIPPYARILIQEGRRDEAGQVLDAWYPFARHMADDADSLIRLLVVHAIIGVVDEKVPAVYEDLGRPEDAERTRRWAARLREPVLEYVETARGERPREASALGRELEASESALERSASTLAGLLLPILPVSEADLAPGRHLEHALLEQVALAAVLALMLLMMLGALVTTIRWRWARGASSAPLLLLPSWQETVRILGFGVLLPLLVFYIYTRWSGLAGREYSLSYLVARFVLELCLLAATISFVTISKATRYIRERCLPLGVPVPGGSGRHRWLAHWIVLGLLWAVCLALREHGTAEWAGVIIGGPGSLFLLLCAVIVMMRRLGASREHGLFRGTAARSLVPVFAAAAILIGILGHVYLTRQEAALVRRDTIIAPDDEFLATAAEADLVRRLKGGLMQAFEEIEAERQAR